MKLIVSRLAGTRSPPSVAAPARALARRATAFRLPARCPRREARGLEPAHEIELVLAVKPSSVQFVGWSRGCRVVCTEKQRSTGPPEFLLGSHNDLVERAHPFDLDHSGAFIRPVGSRPGYPAPRWPAPASGREPPSSPSACPLRAGAPILQVDAALPTDAEHAESRRVAVPSDCQVSEGPVTRDGQGRSCAAPKAATATTRQMWARWRRQCFLQAISAVSSSCKAS